MGEVNIIRKALLLKIFDAAYMQRWNDKLRPVDLIELDKQAHKMIIAYFLGKFEEEQKDFNWIEIIEGGIFELLQRIVITDLKPPLFYKIKEDTAKYKRLNEWVYNKLEPILSPVGGEFCKRFKDYFSSSDNTLNKRILSAAHFYATKWEFDILERADPNGYEIDAIKKNLLRQQEKYYDLTGIAKLTMYDKYRKFIDLCGQLRFQSRWAHLHRIPKTSVLGHMLFVAVLSYLVSSEIKACYRRCVNNYFTGLFHDLPEVLTRDIISPVKRSVEGLNDLIKEYEKEHMEKELYALIPDVWHPEIKMFTGTLEEFPDKESEFYSIVTIDGKIKELASRKISSEHNKDEYNPRDGEIIKAVDDLAAFIEIYTAIKNGSADQELKEAEFLLKSEYKGVNISGINFGEIYADFD
ncbi:MAG: HD domain-containing protein [Thermodesulfobacteriota bacterium]|nr:HD domain-containing protein [Thermodesulfobacteriota bacterium]